MIERKKLIEAFEERLSLDWRDILTMFPMMQIIDDLPEEREVVTFISYSGKPPALCHGTLEFEFNGKRYKVKDCLEPGNGARCWYSKDWQGYVEKGSWKVKSGSLPGEIEWLGPWLEDMANNEIMAPCCGGCL